MSSTTALQPLALDLKLPWVVDSRQEDRFIKMLLRLLIPLFLLFFLVPFLPVFDLEYEPKEPAVTTTVILKPVEVTPFVPPKPKVKPEPQPEQKKAPVQEASPKLVTKQKVKPKVEPKKSVDKSQGLNELSSQLSALRGTLDIARLQTKNVTTSKLGEAKVSTRNFLGQDGAARRSDGVEVSDDMLSGSSTGLGEYRSTSVDGTGRGQAYKSNFSSDRSSKRGERDIESVRRTLERAKSRMFTDYNVARRNYPNLEGKFIFEILIEPSGRISQARLLTSELGVKSLEKSILDKIKSLNFGSQDVLKTKVKYTFNFFPS